MQTVGRTAAACGLDGGTACLRPAETSLEVASGFEASTFRTAEAAAAGDGPALKISGRDEKYLTRMT